MVGDDIHQDALVNLRAFAEDVGCTVTKSDELKAFVKERLAAFKYPRWVDFVVELPKTATGKIQRFKLRENQ